MSTALHTAQQQPVPVQPVAPVPVVQTTGATSIEITKIVLGALTPIMLAWVGLKQPTAPAPAQVPAVHVVTPEETFRDEVRADLKSLRELIEALKPVKKTTLKAAGCQCLIGGVCECGANCRCIIQAPTPKRELTEIDQLRDDLRKWNVTNGPYRIK